jgi:hypothetical protein
MHFFAKAGELFSGADRAKPDLNPRAQDVLTQCPIVSTGLGPNLHGEETDRIVRDLVEVA